MDMQVPFSHYTALVFFRPISPILLVLVLSFPLLAAGSVSASGMPAFDFKSLPESCSPHEEEFEAAAKFLSDGNWDQASFIIQQIESNAPDCPLVYLYLGKLEYYHNNDREALGYFNRIAESHPDLYPLYHYRGLIYLDQGLTTVALEEFHKVMIKNKTIGTGYFFNTILPIIGSNASLDCERIDSLMNYVTVVPAREFTLGLIAFYQDDYTSAVNHFNNLVSHVPDHVRGWLLAGRCYEALGHEFRAIDSYNRAISRNDSFSDAYFFRGLLNIDVNNWYTGCMDLHKARTMDNAAASRAYRSYCAR